MLIFANVLSFISTALLIYSMFTNDKKRMLLIQVVNYVISIISNLLAGSIVAASTNCISIVRNIYYTKSKSLAVMIIISISYLVLGVATNTLGVIGLLPIIACIEYTVCVQLSTDAQTLRFGVLLNLMLWLVHDVSIQLYGFVLTDVILIISTVIALVKYHNVKK